MSCNKRCSFMMAFIAAICFFFNIPMIEAASYKILVVMSYEEDNQWCVSR